LIKGYEQIRELSQAELEYLPTAIRDRMGLEKVGNIKLRNEGMSAGTNFNVARAKVMEHFLATEWTKFNMSLIEPFEDELLDMPEACLLRGCNHIYPEFHPGKKKVESATTDLTEQSNYSPQRRKVF